MNKTWPLLPASSDPLTSGRTYGKREKRRKHETWRQQDEDVDGDLRDAMPRLQVGAIIIISYHIIINNKNDITTR